MWAWIRKNWKWVLFPIGILIAVATLFQRQRTAVVMVPDSRATDLAIEQHDEQTKEREAQAEVKAVEDIRAIEEKHQAVIEKFGDMQRLKLEELKRGKPQDLTNWLLRVGRGEE